MILLALALALPSPAPTEEVAAQARKAEESAFAAVNDKRWCEALALFLDSDRLSPSPDLVFNAAQAAELGGDRARAMQLYTQLLGTTTSADRKGEAKKRISALTRMVEREGPGVACPAAVAPPPPSSEPPPSAALAPPPAPPSTPPRALPPPAPGSPWPWVTAGLGSAAVVAGLAVVVIGAQPWFAHASARAALAEAEKQGATDGVDALYAQQERARGDWIGWGQAAVAGGLAGTLIGVLAAAGGATWGLIEGGAE